MCIHCVHRIAIKEKVDSTRDFKLNLAFALCFKQDDIRLLCWGREMERESKEKWKEEEEEQAHRDKHSHIAACGGSKIYKQNNYILYSSEKWSES